MKLIVVLTMTLLVCFGVCAETWHATESEHFVVRYTKDSGKANEIQAIAEEFYPKITADLGYSTERKITIWFCESQKEFRRAVNAPIQDWAAGCAYPLHARIAIRDPESVKEKRLNLSRLVKHEIAHVIFGIYLGENLKNVPLWFNEGVAMYESEEWSYGHYWSMLVGALGGSIIPLSDMIDEFPQNESRAQLAYAESCSMITFIVNRYGEDAFRKCVRLLAEGNSIDDALIFSTGADISWIESRWLKQLKSRYRWVSLASSWVFLWAVITAIAITAYLRRKVKNRRTLKQWEEEEAEEFWMDFDDYEYEDEEY